MNSFLMRSLLFVPAHIDKLLDSASRSSADVVVLDIEDSVQPISNKQIARDKIISYIESKRFAGYKVFVRVNDRESGELLRDVYQLTIDGIEGFIYPKSRTGEDVYFFDKLIETIEYEKGITPGKYKIIPLIETTSAVLHALEIAKASSRVVSIAYGSEDFISDLEGIHDKAHQSLFTPRAMIAMAARAAGVVPIDTVHVNVHDLEDLELNLKVGKDLGFEGMMALNPKELPLIHQYYSPTETEIADAKEMLSMYEAFEKEGKGVAILNGKFIGPPMVRAAEKTLAKAKMIEQKKV